MLKAFFFLWPKPTMSRNEFIDYYENKHVGLIRRNVPHPADYRRNYPIWNAAFDNADNIQFGSLTAATFPNQDTLMASMAVYGSPSFKPVVNEDEGKFLDVSRMKFTPVDEVIDGHDSHDWTPAPVSTQGLRLIRFVWRPQHLSQAEFMALYEEKGASMVRNSVSACTDYRRNYLRGSDPLGFATPTLAQSGGNDRPYDCDLIEEMFFPHAEQKDAYCAVLDNRTDLDRVIPGIRVSPSVICEVHANLNHPGN